MKLPTLTYLGTTPNGFRYYKGDDSYVYQQYPKEYWKNGHDYGGEFNGWICSSEVWDNTFNKIIVERYL